MALDPQLLDILACPEDKGPLLYFESEDSLYNPRLKRRYAIKDDIPIMSRGKRFFKSSMFCKNNWEAK